MIYKLNAVVTVSTFTEVEADTLEEAIQIAKKRDMCAVHIDNTYSIDDSWLIEELDGVPYNIKEE